MRGVETPSLRVLGELSVDGLDLRTRLDRKARVLLRLLALARGRAIPADALVEALWPTAPPKKPVDQVLVLASRLRRELGKETVLHGDQGYVLSGIDLDLDELAILVAEVERRLAAGETVRAVATARVALALVRGPVPDPEADLDWVLADHAAATRLVARCRRVAATALLEAGEWLDALDLALADAAADPYDEEAVRLVMRAQVLADRPALALATYADLGERLAEELGTDPSPATTDLHTAILRGELTPTAGTTPTGLVGRTSQVAHLDTLAARAREGAVRVAAVRGEAGIGKTTLLQSWSRSRAGLGDIVIAGACGPLDRSAPLDAVLVAITEHLRRHGDSVAATGPEAAALAALLDPAGGRTPAIQLDQVLGPATLYAAVTAVLEAIAGDDVVILTIDDAHLAGPALADWLRFVVRHPLRLLVVLAERPAEGFPLPTTDQVGLGPLDLAACAELVGADRAAALHARSQGHPLFLSELADSPSGPLPPSLVEAVTSRCDQLGEDAELIRTAAVLGTVFGADLDIEVLAGVLGRTSLSVLSGLEVAEARHLLVEQSGRYRFRHDLVRDALAAGTRPGRAALLHREAARSLVRRPDADPLQVAEHARLGGDVHLAAQALRDAADRAASRFDHATADTLLEQSLALVPDEDVVLTRARVQIRQGRYAEAEEAARAATARGPAAEVSAWAAYFDRRFDDAVRYAEDGVLAAEDAGVKARCLMVGGRTLHARGVLDDAEQRLREAVVLADGSDRLTASAWLGVLHAHRGRTTEALDLLRPATLPGLHVDHTSATLHALLFTGHALALAGRPAEALRAFDRYTDEVEHRQVPRFGGRGVNFGAWVLRNLGARAAGVDGHLAALEFADAEGATETRVAALEDLAEESLVVGDVAAATTHLADARAALGGDLVFGWRLEMKLRLLEARFALHRDDPAAALVGAEALARDATAAGVPRYASVAALVAHQARAALGEPVDLDAAWASLATVEQAARLEAWWWAGETGAALGQERWLTRSEELTADLAAASGEYGETLRAEADSRLSGWRAVSRR